MSFNRDHHHHHYFIVSLTDKNKILLSARTFCKICFVFASGKQVEHEEK